MTTWKEFEHRFTTRLGLKRRPVAVSILDKEPTGIRKFVGSEPSGCSFWRLAADGQSFYTVPADHYNCPVGSYTHKIELPANRRQELTDTLGLMFKIEYIRPEEVPGIPQLAKTPAAVVYAPLGDSPVDPGVVLFACRPSAAMLLNEAATRANTTAPLPVLGRPTCMAIPVGISMGSTTSLGCIGNRTYTGITDDDMYASIPGAKLAAVDAALETIVNANAALQDYARGRRSAIATE